MANKRRTGAESDIFIGRQLKRGTFITGDDVFQAKEPKWSTPNNIIAALIRRRFAFIRNTLDPNAETTQSESIIGGNAATPSIITGRSAAGEWEFEVLPDDIIHLMLGWFNPGSLPMNEDIHSIGNDGIIPGGKVTEGTYDSSGKLKELTINNADKSAIAEGWPGYLNIQGKGITGSGKITIYGQQRRSRSNNFNSAVSETFETTAAKITASEGVNSSKVYRQVNRVILSGFDADLTSPVLTFKADTKKALLTLHPTNDTFDGWTTQMNKAGEPFIGYDVTPNEFRFLVSSSGMRLVLTLLASYVQEGRTLLKPLEVAYKLPKFDRPHTGKNTLADYETSASSQSDQKEIKENYPITNLNFYPSQGTAVALGKAGQTLAELKEDVADGTAPIIAINDLEIRGTHNFATDGEQGFTGDPASGEPVTAEGQTRQVFVNATVVHETDEIYSDANETVFWQDRYFEGQEIPIVVRNYNWEPDGRQDMLEWAFPNCKLGELPGLPIEGQGPASRTLAFEASPSAGSSTDTISLEVYSKGGFAE
ncbi:MAG: hypothetical protein OXL96_13810 [Candidatus Poribacteria bacterium]|nr:hypothetical protein [Candidatus Poribacteria bacterium]